MTPVVTGTNPAISYFTLAAFQDMGYYTVDFTKADDFDYGRHAGCSFVNDKCVSASSSSSSSSSSSITPAFQGYFCNQTDTTQAFCNYDLSAISKWSY